MIPLPDGCYRLESLPVGVARADWSLSHLGFGLPQFEELSVAVGEVEPVAAFMTRRRATRERLAVIHRHQEPRLVDAASGLIAHAPARPGPRRREFAVADEGPKAVGAG